MPGTTRTGAFPIGFRRGWSDWNQDLEALLAWATGAGFGAIDLRADGAADVARVGESGLRLGSVDLPEWGGLITPPGPARDDALAVDTAHVRACGAVNHFAVMLPQDPTLPRAVNFGYMVDSLRTLVPVLEAAGARLAIEGYPGPGALCCTPEGFRALFEQVPSPVVGINYDPSHLARMGIDPVRFAREFGGRVHHVHAKDTEVFTELVYELGIEQPATFRKPPAFGGATWRYTIPGHGGVRWTAVFEALRDSGYAGAVSVELEDANFNGTTEGEREALRLSLEFLGGC